MTPEQLDALAIARGLAAAGIPVFVAAADPARPTGFRLPRDWQHTPPDPRIVDTWQPGMALGLVTGHGLDLLDVDAHKGGDVTVLNGSTPRCYAAALTPSGGMHSFIASLGVRSRDNVAPGIDVKAGDHAGQGRGFAFIAPTVKPSKVTGVPQSYRWALAPELSRLLAVLRGEVADDSGRALAAMVEAARAPAAASGTGPEAVPFEQLSADRQAAVRAWVDQAVLGICEELRASGQWAEGQTDDRGRGWEKLQADAALRLGRLARAMWNDLDVVEAEAAFMTAAPTGGGWGHEDVVQKWHQQHLRGEPAEMPALQGAAERDARAWAALGVDPQAAPRAAVPGGQQPGGDVEAEAPPTGRYFGEGGLQALTLAGDVMALSPIRKGRDNIFWTYGGGVWSPDVDVVEDRLVQLLGQRFRKTHLGTIEAVVRSYSDSITCDPVSEFINFTNGLLDWRTGELKPHDPDIPSTVQLGVPYDPQAKCPAFDQFVSEVVPPDVVETIWELIGYLMYSGNPLHKAVMLTGGGRNGKGTFLRVVERVLHRRNFTSVSLADLVENRFMAAQLFGRLANIAGDIDAKFIENTAKFKAITGGDVIPGEHKFKRPFDFVPWAVPVFSANKIPPSADTTVGYLSRWLVVPFPHCFEGREDRTLDLRLQVPSELRGIAAKGAAALPRLLDRGDFEVTASGREAREEFIRRVDQVRTWIAECCVMSPELGCTARTELYNAYKQWAFRDGHRAVRASEFYDRLEAAGALPVIVRGVRGFKYITVLDTGIPGSANLWPNPAPSAPSTPSATAPTAAPSGITGPEKPAEAPQGAAGEASLCTPSEPGISAGQPPSFHNGGAGGAGQTHLDSRAYTQGGKCAESAPPAPKPSKRGSAAASERAAQRRAEQRAAAVAAAAGPRIGLPALVSRDGTARQVSTADAGALLDTLAEAMTVDVETTGYPVGHDLYQLRTVQLGVAGFAVVFDATDPEQTDLVRRHLARPLTLHAHSATADLVPLAAAGLIDADDAWRRMLDTVIPAKLADPASTGSDPALKRLARSVLGDAAVSPEADAARAALFGAGGWLSRTKVTTPWSRSGWAQVDSECLAMVRYAACDVLDTAAVAARLQPPPPAVEARERTAQRMTARITHHGLRVDGEHVQALLDEHTAAKLACARRVRACGVENPGSGPQVAAKLTELGASLPRTNTGRPSVAAGTLDPLRDADGPVGELVRAVLAYRHHETALGTFLTPYRLLVEAGDGRVRPTVYTLGTDTGRMSCVRPNAQQLPRTGGFRACFTADPGYTLISADFSGVELRVAAALSGDRNLRSIVSDPDRDLHWETARQAFGPEATKAQRYAVKRGVFGRIYGGSRTAIARGVGVSEAVAQQIIDALDTTLPELASWSAQVRDSVKAGRNRFVTYSGRTVWMPTDRPYAAPNYCIQGTARELLVDTLLRWEDTPWGGAVLLPVHDELVVMVPEADAEAATAALVDAMTTDLMGVPIVAAASPASFAWGDAS